MAGLDYSDYSQQHSKPQYNFEADKPDALMASIGLIEPENPVDDVLKRIELEQTVLKPIHLPFKRLSAASKLLTPSTFNVIAGDAGAGKSFFALNLVTTCVSQNISCKYLPLESDRTFYLRRLAAMLSKSFAPLNTDENMEAK